MNRQISADVVVVGAGLIGSALAWGLVRQGIGSVVVVDLDLSGEWSSSELNAGGVRATWSQRINLETSKKSIEYFATVADQVGYHPKGYLWLHRPDTWDRALKAQAMHNAAGWPVEVLNAPTIQTRYPFIDKVSDLAGAILGVKDGLVNPNRLKLHYREQAYLDGKAKVEFLDGVFVTGADRVLHSNQEIEWAVSGFQFSDRLSSEQKKEILLKNPSQFPEGSGEPIRIQTKNIINAAGAWAPQLAKILGYHCPSQPLRRQISLFHARGLDLSPYGMVIDPSGVYFHPEAIYGLSGFAVKGEPYGYSFEYDGDAFFQEHIWAPLSERSTFFESLRHVSGWSGLYENSPDHHAIVGSVGNGIYEAHSFSGHGAMQSYAVGMGLPELIATGKYQTLDLSEFSADRFSISERKITEESWVI